MIKGQPKIGRWILCRERKPESEKEVEITYVSKHLETGEPLCFTARAFYEDGTINTEDSSFSWEDTDNWEYDEEKDGYVIPEGWFESISFAEEFGVVDMPVIFCRVPWQCFPRRPWGSPPIHLCRFTVRVHAGP